METFTVEGFPDTKLVLALFKNVKNARDLKTKHLNRVALLDAGMLTTLLVQQLSSAPCFHEMS